MSRWYASAPSNIALIKYMGKTDPSTNRPSNSSLSYTLSHLSTHVEIEAKTADHAPGDEWQPLKLETLENKVLELSDKGRDRYLGHLQRVKDHFGYEGSFIVRSANDFPSDCGLASSASSFAALTLCSYRMLKELSDLQGGEFNEEQVIKDLPIISDLSRQGSGSSCRSFFAPWSIWDGDGARSIDLPYKNLLHIAVIADDQVKEVSSSQAHLNIQSSLLNADRSQRAETRLKDLVKSLEAEDWRMSYEICWAEFWDMHALFETSQPNFGYMNETSFRVLDQVRNMWKGGDGPLCTMDAGPNVHLLFRRDQKDLVRKTMDDLGDIATYCNFTL